jgi:hypothetical protein
VSTSGYLLLVASLPSLYTSGMHGLKVTGTILSIRKSGKEKNITLFPT